MLQPEHSRLAGDIAACLRPEVFGELTPEVIEAIRQHDLGWQESDSVQLAAIGSMPAKPFPLVPVEEAVRCWAESIRRAERISPIRAIVISRHFCALAQSDPAHREFLADETPRREQLEAGLNVPIGDLDRWTAVIGFCDLVSLYLCSGATDPIELPLAHPALPEARNAAKVVLDWDEGNPRFSSPVVKSGATVSINARERLDVSSDLRVRTFSWSFAG
jgi:hypothetical protein